MTEQLLKELKEYISNFDFDLIITSSKRIAIINQDNRKYIQINNSIIVIEILEYFISTNNSFETFFGDVIIKFSTDMYLKEYLSDMQENV